MTKRVAALMKLGNACTVSKKTLTTAATAPSPAQISSPVASKAPKSPIKTSICKIVTLSADKLSAKSLSRAIERQHSEGYEMVIGLDEAGRGPLAGPVVAAACYIPHDALDIPGIADSKLLNEPEREAIYGILTTHPRVTFAYSIVSHEEIDEVNILQASLLGMARACEDVLTQLKHPEGILALADGNQLPKVSIPVQCVVQGDRKVYSIAAASVIAKVTRDRLMLALHEQYPAYNFAQHKGYPTAEHRALLMAHGPCPVHRRSYGPVKRAYEEIDRQAGKGGKEIEEKPVKKAKVTAAEGKVEEVQSKPKPAKAAKVAAGTKKTAAKTKTDGKSEAGPRRSPRLHKSS